MCLCTRVHQVNEQSRSILTPAAQLPQHVSDIAPRLGAILAPVQATPDDHLGTDELDGRHDRNLDAAQHILDATHARRLLVRAPRAQHAAQPSHVPETRSPQALAGDAGVGDGFGLERRQHRKVRQVQPIHDRELVQPDLRPVRAERAEDVVPQRAVDRGDGLHAPGVQGREGCGGPVRWEREWSVGAQYSV